MIASVLLGGLGRRMPGRTKAAVGMGLLGVAIAAIEHLSQQGRKDAAPPPGGGPPPPPGGGPPPPPPGVPVASPAASGAAAVRESEAILLLQAMAAAAWADGALDADERSRIVGRARAAGLAADELELLTATLEQPPAVEAIAAQATTPELAEQVYAASLLALAVDTDAERTYLAGLARRLGLSPAAVARVHSLIGAPPPA